MILHRTAIIFLLIAAISGNGCEGEFIGPGPQVHFTVGEQLSHYSFKKDTVILSDTVLTNTWVIFRAIEDHPTYRWKIGSRTFDTREVKLLFEDHIAKLPVMLVAHTSDRTTDSLVATMNLTVINYWDNPIFGVFNGSNQETPDELFDVEIARENGVHPVSLNNINQGCDPVVPSVGITGFDVSVAYKTIFFSSGFYYQGCNDPSGWVTTDGWGNNITIDYTIGTGTRDHPDGPRVKFHFTGKRKP